MTTTVAATAPPADAAARLRLARTDGVGPQTFRRLLERFGSAAAALEEMPRYGQGRLRAPPEAEAWREMEAVAALGGRFIFLGTPGYPPLLDTLTDPPPVLALLGDPAVLGPRAVAVVGARNASAAGRRIAGDLAEALAGHGLVVVSGMARGIDAAAHLGAMRTGRTVAVVAGGLDQPYPPENTALQARIAAEGGAVLAEAPLGTAPIARHFPRRNRIVAGLVLGVVLVEAAVRSGSLITARLGLEAGREIFAVPGSPLDARCRGSNDLIRQGAHLTEGLEDVLAHLPQAPEAEPSFRYRPSPGRMPATANPGAAAHPPTGDEAQVIDLLGASPISVDDVLRRCHLSTPVVQAILLDLELTGRVEMLPGNRVALTGKG
ncbi:MAG: Rossmann fold nucleotide-binding protein Smf possibly involved in DNA uptake [uncultured Acetobacteraceae bacterium]|uniref:Rossmann fold nucleotide-binding protein Smf possibly involved in DNA uptake n=1 Tax=uncultured Acetobacteraceae bacterium TaxID=169975 RepID=A0A6J4JJ41_9PROT|nr:MAG: Rossmann fold nucleotide-binding protein Smf possibly involved in DNA uptake [uncultured Acetobacteraceae bacterium]